MLDLKPMNQHEYEVYLNDSIKRYADELITSGVSDKDSALEKSKQSFKAALPYGLESKGHYLYLVVNNQGQRIGHVWYGPHDGKEKEAFIYDFQIDELYQGKGFGKESMALVEIDAKANDYDKIALHVFGHNKRAIGLYQSMGYEPYSMHMAKEI